MENAAVHAGPAPSSSRSASPGSQACAGGPRATKPKVYAELSAAEVETLLNRDPRCRGLLRLFALELQPRRPAHQEHPLVRRLVYQNPSGETWPRETIRSIRKLPASRRVCTSSSGSSAGMFWSRFGGTVMTR